MPRGVIPRHEYCFWLHDQTARLLVEASQSGQIEDWNTAVSEALGRAATNVDKDELLAALAENGGTICTPMKIDIFTAVLSDTLHFIFEALKSFEKRKFNVGFSLLRKPLTENLIILCRLTVNDDDFIKSFANGALQQKQVTQIEPKDRIELFDKCISFLPVKSTFSGSLINDIIFNREMSNGLQIRMQKATHLITTRHQSLLTPKFGMNRIFADQHGDDNYSVYDSLPVILFFILQITLHKFSVYLATSNTSTNEVILRAMGIYANIYEGRLDSLSRSINNNLKDLFQCEWCNEGDAKIRKKFSAQFYLNDQIHCKSCNMMSHTPFTYLLRSGKFNIVEQGDDYPSEYGKLFGAASNNQHQ